MSNSRPSFASPPWFFGSVRSMAMLTVVLLALHGSRARAATTWTVSTTADDTGTAACTANVCNTLRDAIRSSSAGDTVDMTGLNGVVSLTNGELLVGHGLAIAGPGANLLNVSGNHAARVFHITGGTVALTGMAVSNGNDLGGDGGGGIYIDSSAASPTVTLSGCAIINNTTAAPGGLGGGGILNDGTLTLDQCIFTGNSAGQNQGDGGALLNHSTATIRRCSFNDNSAPNGQGGGLNNSGTMTVINSTITGNSAGGSFGEGGGVFEFKNGTLNIVNSTIAGNSGSIGGGISNGYYGFATVSLLNTIVIGNTATNNDADVEGPYDQSGTIGNNLIGNVGDATGFGASNNDLIGGSSAPNIFMATVLQTDGNGNPLLASNGGPTPTIALMPGSPAIDFGNDAVIQAPDSLTTDQRGVGFSRLSGSHVDIGAFEIQVAPPPAPVITGFSPTSGLVGSSVTLTGTSLSSASKVTFTGGSLATPINVTDITATVTVPTNAQTGPLTITTPGGTSAPSSQTFTVTLPPPPLSITSFAPTTGPVGTSVTIVGINLTGATTVTFAGGVTAVPTGVTATSATVLVPAGALSGSITITANAGTSPASSQTFAVIDELPSLVVTTTSDIVLNDGFTSLREAIAYAQSGNAPATTITFAIPSTDANYHGGAPVITLNGTELLVNASLAIDAQGQNITVSGNQKSRVFHIAGGTVSLNGLTIRNGYVTGDNGGGIANFGVLAIAGSTIAGCAADYGGGIFNDGTLAIGNSTVCHNTASFQGAGILTSVVLTIINSTINGNASGSVGGGIAIFNGKASLLNTIVSGNGAANSDADVQGVFDSTGTVGNNLIGDIGDASGFSTADHDQFGTDAVPLDAELDPKGLQNNGGPTQTIALTSGSPAIDAGNDTVVSQLTNDQRGAGFARLSGSHVDIGAFEFHSPLKAQAQQVSVPENGSVTIILAATGGAGNFIYSAPATSINGSLGAVVGNQVIYTPTPGFAGSDSFGFTVTDSANTTSNATVTIAVVAPVPPPAIRAFSPTTGPIGTVVTITGTHLIGTTGATIGGVPVPTPTSVTDGSLKITIPKTAQSGKVTVTTPGGTATSKASFTVVPRPALAGFAPTIGPVGTVVTITGTNLTNATTTRPTVMFGGIAGIFLGANATTVTALVPSGAGIGKVTVTTTGGTTYSAGNFITVGRPVITTFSPSTGPAGTVVTIMGSGFTNLLQSKPIVTFGGLNALVTVPSNTSLTVIVPAGAVPGKIGVTTYGGTALSAASFLAVGKPTIATLTPGSGAVGATVDIKGLNLTNLTTPKPTVKFGTVVATAVSVVSSSEIKVTVPRGAVTGKISVTTTGGTAASAANFTIVAAAPAATEEFSTSRISSASARVATQTVQLNFAGTLDDESATDAGHYTVTINGAAAEAQSAEYARGMVTLGLPDGSMQVGDPMIVTWTGLLDGRGRELAAGSSVMTAR